MPMEAKPGDWLVVKSSRDNRHERRAEILEVRRADRRPPYRVRWLDDGRETLVFPGPDAVIVTVEQQAEIDRAERRRIERIQQMIAAEREAHPAERVSGTR